MPSAPPWRKCWASPKPPFRWWHPAPWARCRWRIREYELEQAGSAKPLINDYKADLESWEVKRSGIKDKIRQLAKDKKPTAELEAALRELEHEKPEAPRVQKLIRGGETPEHLAGVLAKEWPSGGVVSSDAGIVFGAHGMGKESIMRNLALLKSCGTAAHCQSGGARLNRSRCAARG